MVHTFSSFVLVSVLLYVGMSAAPGNKAPLFWYSTKALITEYTQIDFRGCHGPECVYVASTPLPNVASKILGRFMPSQKMWAVAHAGADHVEYIFSAERPKELETTLWISPVAENSVMPAKFNASRFSADPDPHVAEFLERLDQASIQSYDQQLASYNSRNSHSPDALTAANWLKDFMDANGCEKSQLMQFRANWAPNVLCQITGTDPSEPAIVVGAHYDSRSTNVNSPTQRAPGADDNGSGSAAILEILKTATSLIAEEGYSFENTVIFAFFAGEEQGLVGSAALATSYVNAGVDLTAMVNLDMIGYPERNAPQTLYWMSGSTTASLTQLAIELTKTYLGENTVLATTGACCSDQQSFYSRGYAAASIFESRSATNNPNYHQSSDLPATVNFNHVLRNTKSAAALITTLAGLSGPLKR